MELLPSNSPRVQPYWNLSEEKLEFENIRGAKLLTWCFERRVGKLLLDHILATRFFAQISYGWIANLRLTPKRIQKMIEEFSEENGICREEFEDGPFPTFNHFFARRFKKGKRSFPVDPRAFPAFAEGKYLAYQKSPSTLRIKEQALAPSDLLGNNHYTPFVDGPILVCRLRAADYHRFHFPDAGEILWSYRLHGSLHATNPISYRYNERVLIQNERQISILSTNNFGLLAYIEIGAMNVGKIVQTKIGNSFAKGEEKGHFLLGGSTVVILGEKDRWSPDPSMLDRTAKGIETLVHLGEVVGQGP